MVTIGEKPWVRVVEVSDKFGQFVVEPLPRGYGTTLGNPLRRILLSSLPGAKPLTASRPSRVRITLAVLSSSWLVRRGAGWKPWILE